MKNQFMKPIFVFIITIFSSCNNSQSNKDLKAKIVHSVTLGGYMTCDTTNYIFIRSNLLNTSDDTLVYVRMMCPSWSAYALDSKDLFFETEPCFINGANTIKIAPHKSLDLFLKLVSPKNISEWENVNFRLGFNCIVRDTTKNLFTQAEESENMKNIVWSDTIKLKNFWQH